MSDPESEIEGTSREVATKIEALIGEHDGRVIPVPDAVRESIPAFRDASYAHLIKDIGHLSVAMVGAGPEMTFKSLRMLAIVDGIPKLLDHQRKPGDAEISLGDLLRSMVDYKEGRGPKVKLEDVEDFSRALDLFPG